MSYQKTVPMNISDEANIAYSSSYPEQSSASGVDISDLEAEQVEAELEQAKLDMLARGNQKFISTPEYARNNIMGDKIAQDYAREVKFWNDPKLKTPVIGSIRATAHHFERGEVIDN